MRPKVVAMQNRFRRGRIQFPALRCVPLLVALTLLFISGRAEAYPWMIRHGYTNCGACHADPSGGELLTPYGHMISYEALSTKWGGNKEAARLEDRRIAAAIARAAVAKSAPKKRIAAEKVELDDEPAGKGAAAPKAKDAAAAAPPAKAAPEAATPAKTEEETEGAEKKPEKKAGGEDEESAEEEGAAEEAGSEPAAEAGAASSESSAADSNPLAGTSAITGPLFGIMKPKEELLLGGSWRFATTYKFEPGEAKFFPMQLDLYGQYRFLKNFRVSLGLGAAKVPAGSPHARAAQVTRNQEDGYNLISRTHWVGYEFGDGQHLIRAGRMNLPSGIRMSEHVMWVREKTQTDRESDQQHGVALYLGFDSLRLEVMGIAGNFQVNPDEFRERGYAGYAEFVLGEKATVGVSSLYTEAKNDRVYIEGLRTARGAHGVFARTAPSSTISVLAEADVLHRSRREIGYVGFLQFDVEALSGLHAIATAELLDAGFPNKNPNAPARAAGLGEPALGGWLSLQWFFLPHFDLRVDAIVRSEKMILSQLHVYL